LAKFEEDKDTLDLGTPHIAKQSTAKVIAHIKGDKVRIAKFKAKVRYRKVTGFRAALSKLKILTI
jgi:large subunit ribosomal protein L21